MAAVFPVQYKICTIGDGLGDLKTFFEYIVIGYRTMFMPKVVPELPFKVDIPYKATPIILYCFGDEPFFQISSWIF